MRLKSVFLLLFAVLSTVGYSQSSLLINEVSQGSSGAREYVELVVAGVPPGCSGTVPAMDLRGIVIDDNNGNFGSGSGNGIATGALRFANTAFWSAIPQGTIIVIYNENEKDPSIPADDASMTDGNSRLILPASSSLLEGSGTSPSTSSSTYQPNGSWSAGSGTWASVGLANSGDCMQVRQSITASSASHSVGYGSISNPVTNVYFSQSGGATVYYCNNSPVTSGWSVGTAAANQTPGAPNNALNAAYIQSFVSGSGNSGLQVSISKTEESCANACDAALASTVTGGATPYSYSWNTGATTPGLSDRCAGNYTLTVTDNNGCTGNASATITGASPIQVSAAKTDETCASSCDGAASVSVSGGSSPYSVSWSNGAAGTAISSLCPAVYTASVTDNNGCSASASVTIAAGATPGNPDFITTGPFEATVPAVQLENQTHGGVYTTTDCSGCLTSTGVFSPQIAGPGSYNICYTISNQGCSASDCATFVVGDCVPQSTSQSLTFCHGDSVLVFGSWKTDAGVYSQSFTASNGCDSTHTVILSFNTDGSCGDNELNLYIPNVFTPNGDSTNDVFKIELTGGLIIEGFIFNRWGNVIAEFSEEVNSWDGHVKNSADMASDGVYTYMVRYSVAGGNAKIAHGHVTLIR